MTSRHTLTHADEVYLGDVKYGKYSPDGRRGLRVGQLFTHEFGAPATIDPNGMLVNATATATGGTTFTLATGAALVATAGTATFDVPRNIVISTANTGASGATFTFSGTDTYGEAVSEAITGPASATGGTVTAAGAKAFKTITAASVDIAVTGNINIGTGDVLGSPIKLADKGKVIAFSMDGLPLTPTIVAGLATGTAATTTNADVRGTITMATGSAPNGTRRYTALFSVAANRRKIDVFGNTQA